MATDNITHQDVKNAYLAGKADGRRGHLGFVPNRWSGHPLLRTQWLAGHRMVSGRGRRLVQMELFNVR